MYGNRCKRVGITLRQKKVEDPKAAFEARKNKIGERKEGCPMYAEFFTPETAAGNGKHRIEHWSFGRCTMIELFEQA